MVESQGITTLTSIVHEFTCHPNCGICDGIGIVCEDHPHQAWGDDHQDFCGPGMPCPMIGKTFD